MTPEQARQLAPRAWLAEATVASGCRDPDQLAVRPGGRLQCTWVDQGGYTLYLVIPAHTTPDWKHEAILTEGDDCDGLQQAWELATPADFAAAWGTFERL